MQRSIRLSGRMEALRAEGSYEILAQATQLEAQGKNIVHFEIGQPDFPTPKPIVTAGIDALKKGFTKYTPPLGISPLRQEIAEYLHKTRGANVTEQNIAVTPSGKTAIFVAMSAILEKGDEVIYPNPGFPTYQTLIDYFGCVRKPVPLVQENSFSFDMKKFRKLFSRKTKMIILNSPSNPTGGVMPKEDLLEIADMVKGTSCWVLTDEMYARIVYNNSFTSFYGISKHPLTILIDGFSKTYSMTGWRIGYLSVPKHIVDRIGFLLTHTIGCTASFTQHAALAGLKYTDAYIPKMVNEFKKRRDIVVESLNEIPGIDCPVPDGAFYAFPNITATNKSSKWLANYLLQEAGVALLDGANFGEYGNGYLRISYATSVENINEGIKRIAIALKKL